MLTYSLLALAAIFILNRWVQLYKIKRSPIMSETIDAGLQSRLNPGEQHVK